MCSLVNAKSGGCAEDCGFCAQSKYADAETPMHAMMEPEQMLEHARAAEAAGAHRFCMVTQGQGLSKRDFAKVARGREAGRGAHEPEALRLDRPHVARAREAAEGGRHPARAPQRRDGAQLLRRGLHDRRATRAGCARSRPCATPGSRPASAASSTSARPAAQRVEMAFELAELDPTSVPINLLNPRAGHEVRRPRPDRPVGGGQVHRDLPPDPARGAVPPLRRPRREPRRAAAAGREGGPERRDDGQLPHDARLRARGRPRACSRSSA